jgi:hypothetical protein
MHTNSYATYSLDQVLQAIARMGYGSLKWEDFPNRPLVLGLLPIIFSLPESVAEYVIHFRRAETKYYRNGSLGIILSHYYDSESPDDIEGSVIETKLYELDEVEDGESKELACVQFFSTSKGYDERSSAGGDRSFGGKLVKTRAQLQQTVEFLQGFIGIVPEPPSS